MKIPSKRAITLGIAGIVGAVAVACGSSAVTDTNPVPTLTADPETPAVPASPSEAANGGATQEAPTSAPASVTQPPSIGDYDPNLQLFKIFPGFAIVSPIKLKEALAEVEEQNDISQVPVLVESIRFLSSRNSREASASTLSKLTGQSFDADDWNGWMEWLGKHRDEFPPPEKYADWKIMIMSQVDPRFRLFLRDAKETSRIDLTEVVWGGVIPDGIPDLRNPPFLSAGAADFLGDNERVFGVEINGEARAYPLRIINAHEMINDVLGGEPFALSW